MSRFNTPQTSGPDVTNEAGGKAFSTSPREALLAILLTSFLQDKYYETAATETKRLNALVALDPAFAAKAATYARHVFGMRTISHVVAIQIANAVKGAAWTKDFFDRVVRRPDDVLEIVAGQLANGKLTNPMRKGLGRALARFDEYQLAKYQKKGATVSMIDAVNLLHPPATPALTALMTGTLEAADTWEVALTRAGQADEVVEKEGMKAEAWERLIRDRKLGYFALLRNLRNIHLQAPAALNAALEMLVDEKLIRTSLVLPYRFLSAFEALSNAATPPKVMEAVGQAAQIALANVPVFPGRSCVICDHSGSMGNGFASNSAKAAMFGLALFEQGETDFMHFGDAAKYVSFSRKALLPNLKSYDAMNSGWMAGSSGHSVGHGTNFVATLEALTKKYDRLIYFSDMQGWLENGAPVDALADYKRKFSADPWIYSVNLAGTPSDMFGGGKVIRLAGISDRIFDFMKIAEQDRSAIIKAIEAY